MKKLKAPLLTTLDVLDLSSVGFLMETKAHRDYIECINWESFPYKPIAAFDIARSETSLYIRFFVRGNSLKAAFETDDSPVFNDSCVEFFMQKENDPEYMNFEFNCIGTCDASRRFSRDNKRSLSQAEYKSIRRHPSMERKAFAEKQGVHSWELVVSIPFTVMGLDPQALPEKIYGNFYKCADNTEFPHYVSWNPINTEMPDFHRPEFFGEITL